MCERWSKRQIGKTVVVFEKDTTRLCVLYGKRKREASLMSTYGRLCVMR